MIYTSYFSNKEAMASGAKIVSIARYKPAWAKVDAVDDRLMPDADLLNAYKNGEIDEITYTVKFQDQLSKFSADKIAIELDGCILMCYEAPGEFCHRNLVRAWLSKHGHKSVEFGSGPVQTKKYDAPRVSIEEWYTESLLRKNPGKIFVFGDNLEQNGKGGQAVIRGEPNAYGVPTKRKPSMSQDSFFSDQVDELEAVKNSLRDLYKLMTGGYEIVFPKDGLGTGLAELESRSPLIFKEMNEILERHFYPHIKGQMGLFD